MKLDALFRQPDTLPVMPEITQALIASFNDENVTIEHLTQHIASDPVLSAKLLQLANSPYYHAAQSIATISTAVALLGFVNLRTLVISLGLKSCFKPIPGFDARRFWRHSLHTALAARHLATSLKLNAEHAFTLGLLHAIGQPVMHLAMPEKLLSLDQQAPLLAENRVALERENLGYSYLDVSAELARHWQFPPLFGQTLGASAAPLTHPDSTPLAALVHLAAWRSRAAENRLTSETMADTWPGDIAASIALPNALALQDFPAWEVLDAGMAAWLAE